eukprot:569466-Rhodomonas_salina.2
MSLRSWRSRSMLAGCRDRQTRCFRRCFLQWGESNLKVRHTGRMGRTRSETGGHSRGNARRL